MIVTREVQDKLIEMRQESLRRLEAEKAKAIEVTATPVSPVPPAV